MYDDPVQVVWPFAWSARQDGDATALLDPSGTVIAEAPRHVSISGVQRDDSVVIACDTLSVGIPTVMAVGP
jgi:hypothetical protein